LRDEVRQRGLTRTPFIADLEPWKELPFQQVEDAAHRPPGEA
jgi:hypothetical protein